MTHKIRIQPAILSGGSGTRLWPLSREYYPKQLLPLVGELSLLQETINRLEGLGWEGGAADNSGESPCWAEVSPPIVVCNEQHRFLVAEQVHRIGATKASIILEPQGRNTAPALTLAALAVAETGEDAILLVMPADHIVRDKQAFHKTVEQGSRLADAGYLVTFGIVPTRPETGYGYIRIGRPIPDGQTPGIESFGIESFVEKPDMVTAQKYISSPSHLHSYLWNSGMFMMRASVWMAAITRYNVAIAEACREAYQRGRHDLDFFRVDGEAFAACHSDSIDYAVMEKITGDTAPLSPDQPSPDQPSAGAGILTAAVIPLDAGWSDVGSWSAIWEVRERDDCGNVVKGDVHSVNSFDNLIYAEDRLVTTVGVKDHIIVETADAVMIAAKDQVQDVRKIVQWLKRENRPERQLHKKVYRPWGSYEGVVFGDRFQVKLIIVKPGAALSLQMHHHRAEHWIIVRGTARITCGKEVLLLSENQSTYIPLGTTHRLENPGNIPLEMIEVQSGSYLGEDDIVRFEDNYGRDEN